MRAASVTVGAILIFIAMVLNFQMEPSHVGLHRGLPSYDGAGLVMSLGGLGIFMVGLGLYAFKKDDKDGKGGK